MKQIDVRTLNSHYLLEEDDFGITKIIDTDSDVGKSFIGLKCTYPVIGMVIRVENGKGGHTSKVVSIV